MGREARTNYHTSKSIYVASKSYHAALKPRIRSVFTACRVPGRHLCCRVIDPIGSHPAPGQAVSRRATLLPHSLRPCPLLLVKNRSCRGNLRRNDHMSKNHEPKPHAPCHLAPELPYPRP